MNILLGNKPEEPLPVKTAITDPLKPTFVPTDDTPGKLGFCMCPGRCKPKKKHEWRRDADTDVAVLNQVGCDLLVTLMQEDEIKRDAPGLHSALQKYGIKQVRFPIPDKRNPPKSEKFMDLIKHIAKVLDAHGTVIVHCNGGKGRSALVTATMLVWYDKGVKEAIDTVHKLLSGTLQNPLQQLYLRRLYTFKTLAGAKKEYEKKHPSPVKLGHDQEAQQQTPPVAASRGDVTFPPTHTTTGTSPPSPLPPTSPTAQSPIATPSPPPLPPPGTHKEFPYVSHTEENHKSPSPLPPSKPNNLKITTSGPAMNPHAATTSPPLLTPSATPIVYSAGSTGTTDSARFPSTNNYQADVFGGGHETSGFGAVQSLNFPATPSTTGSRHVTAEERVPELYT